MSQVGTESYQPGEQTTTPQQQKQNGHIPITRPQPTMPTQTFGAKLIIQCHPARVQTATLHESQNGGAADASNNIHTTTDGTLNNQTVIRLQ